jgi:hypothetical protein
MIKPEVPRPKIKRNDLLNTAKGKRDELLLDPAQKFVWVESQIRRVTLGQEQTIGCPYCMSSVMVGVDRLCCVPMGEAVATVLQSMEADYVRETDGFGIFALGLTITESDDTNNSSDVNDSRQSIQ